MTGSTYNIKMVMDLYYLIFKDIITIVSIIYVKVLYVAHYKYFPFPSLTCVL